MIDRLLIATANTNKLREIQAVLDEITNLNVSLLSLADLPQVPKEPIEDGETFEENAALKATHYAWSTGLWCLADDSGLQVDALGGEPGVRSARYAGASGDRRQRDGANNAKLLAALEVVGDAERTARFVCVMALADPAGSVRFTVRGTLEGRIARQPRGEGGFGYDPLLLLADGRTVAELTPNEKNGLSHRGQAARQVAAHLAELLQRGSNETPF